MWTLIIVLTFWGGDPQGFTQNYKTKKECLETRQQILKIHHASTQTISARCVHDEPPHYPLSGGEKE